MNAPPSDREAVWDRRPRSEAAWPRTYRIAVEGRLDPNWSELLAGLKITSPSSDRGGASAVLTGSIRDDAELLGVLNTLYDLQL